MLFFHQRNLVCLLSWSCLSNLRLSDLLKGAILSTVLLQSPNNTSLQEQPLSNKSILWDPRDWTLDPWMKQLTASLSLRWTTHETFMNNLMSQKDLSEIVRFWIRKKIAGFAKVWELCHWVFERFYLRQLVVSESRLVWVIYIYSFSRCLQSNYLGVQREQFILKWDVLQSEVLLRI